VNKKKKTKEYESLFCLANTSVSRKQPWKEEILVVAHTLHDSELGADPRTPVSQETCSAGSRTMAALTKVLVLGLDILTLELSHSSLPRKGTQRDK